MGVYKYYMTFNGRPAYHKSNGRRLYFLAGSGWLVGAQVGAQTGFVHHASQYRDVWSKRRAPGCVIPCPECCSIKYVLIGFLNSLPPKINHREKSSVRFF